MTKVVKDVSGIIASDEADIMTRMEVFSGVITEMEKMFTVLSVGTTFISFNHSFFPGFFIYFFYKITLFAPLTLQYSIYRTLFTSLQYKNNNEINMYH